MADPADEPRLEGVELFVERPIAARHDFTLEPSDEAFVAHVCHRLDAMPLAIELAAGPHALDEDQCRSACFDCCAISFRRSPHWAASKLSA